MRGQRVTFAALFALGMLGLSVIHLLRRMLHAMHAPWYLWLLLPFVLVSAASRWETRLLPDERQRKLWARGLVFGSIVLALVIAKLAPNPPSDQLRQTTTPETRK